LVGGHHGDLTRLIAVEMTFFLQPLVLISTGEKWELVNFSKRLFPEMQTSVSGFLFFLKESK